MNDSSDPSRCPSQLRDPALEAPLGAWAALALAVCLTIALAALAFSPVIASIDLVEREYCLMMLAVGFAWLGSWQLVLKAG